MPTRPCGLETTPVGKGGESGRLGASVKRKDANVATSRNGLVGERTAANGTRRVNGNFSDEAYDALVELARAKSKTISDVLREAIAFEKYLKSGSGRAFAKKRL